MASTSSISQAGFLVLLCLSLCSARRVLIDSVNVDASSSVRFLGAAQADISRGGDGVQVSGGSGKLHSISSLSDSKWQSGGKSCHCDGGGYCGGNCCGYVSGGCGGEGRCGGNYPGSCCSPPLPPPPQSCQPLSNCYPTNCPPPASNCYPTTCLPPASNCYPTTCPPPASSCYPATCPPSSTGCTTTCPPPASGCCTAGCQPTFGHPNTAVQPRAQVQSANAPKTGKSDNNEASSTSNNGVLGSEPQNTLNTNINQGNADAKTSANDYDDAQDVNPSSNTETQLESRTEEKRSLESTQESENNSDDKMQKEDGNENEPVN